MGNVLDELAPRFRERRADLVEVAEVLPAAKAVPKDEAALELEPRPVWEEEGTKNVEILMESQLAAPDEDPPFDLRLSDALLRGIQWTGPDSPLAEGARSNSASDDFRDELEAALETRWLVVVRVVGHQPPVAIDGERFRAGAIRLQAILVDLETKQPVGAFEFGARTSEQVEYVYREGSGDQKERLQAWAESSLWENARKELLARLPAATGGTFRRSE